MNSANQWSEMMSNDNHTAFDAHNPKLAALLPMRDEIASETKQLQWKEMGLSFLGGGLGVAAGIAGTFALGAPVVAPSLIMAGGMAGSLAGGTAAMMLTVEERKKLEINEKLMDAEMSRINAQNWGDYYAKPASMNNAYMPPPPVFQASASSKPQLNLA